MSGHEKNGRREIIERITGLSSIVAAGTVTVIHAASHILPAIGALGYSYSHDQEHSSIMEKIVSHPAMNVAMATLIPVGIFYMVRDYRRHKKHDQELERMGEENKFLKKELKRYLMIKRYEDTMKK